MADENKKPQDDEGVAVTPDYKPEGEAEKLDADTPLEAGVKAGLELTAAAEDNPVVEAVDNAIKGVMHAAEEIVEGDETIIEHHYSDTFAIPFYGEMTLPGGIYTFIFGVLAALTVIEVLLSFVSVVMVRAPLLLVIAFAKAILVIAFYMHLTRDNWLFRFVLGVPFFVTLISVMYLLGLPTNNYSVFGN